MLAIDEEKLPPPKPAVAAHASRTQNWVSWLCSASQPLGTTIASSSVGISSSAALIVVHARPPKRRHGERVGDPQRRADQVRHRRQPERLGQRQRDADVAEVDHDDRPEHPDAEAEVLGEDREARGSCAAIRLPVVSQNGSSSGPSARSSVPLRWLMQSPVSSYGAAQGRQRSEGPLYDRRVGNSRGGFRHVVENLNRGVQVPPRTPVLDRAARDAAARPSSPPRAVDGAVARLGSREPSRAGSRRGDRLARLRIAAAEQQQEAGRELAREARTGPGSAARGGSARAGAPPRRRRRSRSAPRGCPPCGRASAWRRPGRRAIAVHRRRARAPGSVSASATARKSSCFRGRAIAEANLNHARLRFRHRVEIRLATFDTRRYGLRGARPSVAVAMSGILVIGGGIAGQSVCERVRERDPDVPLTLLCKEPELPYDRVALSHLLAGETTRDELQLRPAEWYADRASTSASAPRRASCDLDAGTCALDGRQRARVRPRGPLHRLGPAAAADRGDRPAGRARLPRPGRLRRDRRARARGAQHAVVIGGGLLGLEAARGIAALGCPATVVHLVDRLMERQLDAGAARAAARRRWRELGVEVRLEAQTAALVGRRTRSSGCASPTAPSSRPTSSSSRSGSGRRSSSRARAGLDGRARHRRRRPDGHEPPARARGRRVRAAPRHRLRARRADLRAGGRGGADAHRGRRPPTRARCRRRSSR